MKKKLFTNEIIYHIYPYGMCNCLRYNDFDSEVSNNLEILKNELPNIKKKGFTAILIGPICESVFHGYDTVDYFSVDRRLGDEKMLKSFCNKAHDLGLKVIFDTVFNHSGRLFFAFLDIRIHKEKSKYQNWYNIDFSKKSEFNDDFDYEGWQGSKDLVKYNLENNEVRKYLLGVLKYWIETFNIDGVRLDAAHLMSTSFLQEISSFTKAINPDFWLLGEVIHGNYSAFLEKTDLDSCTDYQIYEQFYKAFNEKDFFILSDELEREFGSNGIYKNNSLYIFLDNQDVNRIASNLNDFQYLVPLYIILFSLPGIPSIYYGSEYGIKGKRTPYNDCDIRIPMPPFTTSIPDWAYPNINPHMLEKTIEILCDVRKSSKALINNNFKIEKVTKTFICFRRWYEDETVILGINIGSEVEYMDLYQSEMTDLFTGEIYTKNNNNFPFQPNEIYLMSNKKIREKTKN